MFVKSFFKPVLLAAAVVVCSCLQGQAVKVIKPFGESTKNPTVYIKDIAGNNNVSAQVTSDIIRCGWFDVVKSPAADYVVYGAYSNEMLFIKVRTSANKLVCSIKCRINPSDASYGIHCAVDEILKKLFKIPGICATRIVFSVKTTAKSKNIYICDFDGSDIRQITHHNNLCVEPEWFPDGKSLIYTMYGNSRTNLIQTVLNPFRSRILVRMRGLNTGGSISPNGRYMALVMSRDKQVELYVKEVESGNMRRLTRSKAVEAAPCWSPGGGKICFVSDLDRRQSLYVISANGGTPVRLKTQGMEATSPAWAKNGAIAYSSRVGKSYAIAITNSKDPRVPNGIITNAAGDWESPSWAPDSRHIICSRNYKGLSSLYVIDTWTKKYRRLVNSRFDMTFPSWSNPY